MSFLVVLVVRPHYQDMESKQLVLISRKKHREAAKMKRQRNVERTHQNSRIRTNQNGDKQFITVEFKTLVLRMLKELSEDLNSLKKILSETKNTLIEIKNNL